MARLASGAIVNSARKSARELHCIKFGRAGAGFAMRGGLTGPDCRIVGVERMAVARLAGTSDLILVDSGFLDSWKHVMGWQSLPAAAIVRGTMRRSTIVAMSLLAGHASAYESENAVPLSITAALGRVSIERLAINLNGHEVRITSTLANADPTRQVAAFYGSTPVFGQSGIAEEYLDKSFSDLAIRVNHRPHQVTTVRRGFFMGRDITAMLLKAGLSPLPDIDADWKKVARLPAVNGVKPERWEGQVVHGWTVAVPARRTSTHQVRYRSMPQFGYEAVDSAQFDTAVRQHCGDPAAVKKRIGAHAEPAGYVLVERHEIPVSLLALREVEISVNQSSKSAAGPLALTSLSCGLENAQTGAEMQGVIAVGSQSLSVLVISALRQ